MKLRAVILRAMTLLPKERKRATIVREGEPSILNFEQIKNLATQWNERLAPITDGFSRVAPRHGR
jgi:hypothetical protein